jgi:hypothetical protein
MDNKEEPKVLEVSSTREIPNGFSGIIKWLFDNLKQWYLNGKLHQEDGPAVIGADGAKSWWLNDKLHRVGGPAVERANGTKEWFRNGKRHREDGPAVEYKSGRKDWFVNGKRHREDGPAVEWPNGGKSWYLNDNFISWDGYILNTSFIVIERGIPTNDMFGNLKLTHAKILTGEGTIFVYDNLPGLDFGEGNG